MLQSLSRMPKEMSSESRRQLLNAVTDLFLRDGEPTEAAKSHYGEIALQTLPHLPAEERRDYAEGVAATPTLPRQVAVALADDADADVARLVLKLSPVLTDSDLAAVALGQTQAHLLAIAERARLSESLTEILVERGDSAVLETVSSNEGASFSDSGFERLLERGDAAVGQALSRRSDLAPDRAQRVLHIVQQLTEAGEAGSREAATLARQARQQRREVRLLIADLQSGERKLDDIVVMLAEEDRAVHLAQVLAVAAGIANDQVLRALLQRDVSAAAVLCRVLQIGKETFREVLELRRRRLYFANQDLDADCDAYVALDLATAERTLRFLRLKTSVG
jgi:uncharacterized protein (DUF2336 family)